MLGSRVLSLVCVAVLAGAWTAGTGTRGRGAASAHTEIVTHDNVTPAGELRDGILTIELVAGRGNWYPEGDAGPAHDVYAFGEAGKPLSNPGPLLRVPAGTEVRATIHNTIADAPLVVHGLHDRPGAPAPVTVPAGGTTSVSFRLTLPGTYLYWGTTRGAHVLRDRFGQESQLLGVLIVDAPGAVPADHVFVLGIEDEAGPIPAERRLRAAVINGRSWPHSAITTVHVGDTVRMRWVNATDRVHPMHLHGFYFRVDARGDITRDTIYDTEQQRLAVTELLPQGSTMALQWVPERAGNWLMHCHMTLHVAPELRRGAKHVAHDVLRNHTLEVMAGLVIGWRVLPRGAGRAPAAAVHHRKLRLLVQAVPRRYASEPGLGFVLQEGDVAPRADSVVIPGPPLVLVRGEPVEIAVVNRMREPTSIHWHGIELDSYYDGVSGWSGAGDRVAPHVMPGDSFLVRFTPPRAGTFIYHSHFDEERQLSSGLYGPLLVLEPGVTYDPATDQPWVLSRRGPDETAPVMLNGSTTPVIELEAQRTYRIRLININPNQPLVLSIVADSVPVRWRAVAKDGATLPAAQARQGPATVRMGVGEAYDFEVMPDGARELQLRVTDLAGLPRLSGIVRVRPAR